MTYNLPTRAEALAITEKTEAFYVSRREVQGYQVEMYDYRLASYMDFKDNDAFELRGLTFVLNPETNEWERHLALQKFFNINQTLEWMYEDVAGKKIVGVSDKSDGSMITFVRLPNGNIVAKTKMSFVSEQAEMAQKIFDENEGYRNFITLSINMGYTPVFEIVSPHNQIVLSYTDTELRLLQVRKPNGEYVKYSTLVQRANEHGMKLSHVLPDHYHDLDKLLALKLTEELIEGYVVVFEDGQMAKIKTEWYMQLHGLVTEGTRENLLIKTILDDNIDDVLSQLVGDSEKRTFIEETTNLVTHHFNHHVALIKEKLTTYDGDRKAYVDVHRNYEYFSVLMRFVGTEIHELAIEETLKDVIVKKTNGLAKAQEFLAKIKEV